jgi:hypothetical protein
MITAVDTSVLLAVLKGEDDAEQWAERLARCRAGGDLVLCDVVAAELFALLLDDAKFKRTLSEFSIGYSPISIEAACLAGRIFRSYRREGGPREHLVPDFLVGAHAVRQADQLAAVDRGYLRRYFPRLRVVGL